MESYLDIQSQIIKAELSVSQFEKLGAYITKCYGIRLPIEKKVMLQSRLKKRLKELKFSNFQQYIDYLFENESENKYLIIEVSTNKTDMFRENNHFEYLKNDYLPKYLKSNSVNSKLKVWSSACSSGEEPYTLAIVFQEYILKNTFFNYDIYATDISEDILKKAIYAVYDISRIKDIPLELKKRYYLKGTGEKANTVRLKKEIRNKVKFAALNLMDKSYETPDIYDIIFCRNVLIYFNKERQEHVISRLLKRMKKGGILFIGHSESLMDMDLPIKMIMPTVFEKI